MLDVAMIERGLEKTGKSKGGLAAAMGVRPGAVSEILGGERLVKASEIIPIMEYLELNLAPIMGRVGAGAVIEPDYEQVPPEGLGDHSDHGISRAQSRTDHGSRGCQRRD